MARAIEIGLPIGRRGRGGGANAGAYRFRSPDGDRSHTFSPTIDRALNCLKSNAAAVRTRQV